MARPIDWTAFVRARLRLTGLKETRETEIIEDVARQLDDACREAIAGGATETDARVRAERHIADWDALARDLSGTSRERKAAVDAWSERLDDRATAGGRSLSQLARLRQDLVHGWRALRGAPGITAVAVLSLALGIGANTAIFSVTRALTFRTLPVPHPETLVTLTDPESEGIMTGVEDGDRSLLSYHEFEGIRADSGAVLDGILAFGSSVLPTPVAIGDNGTGPRAAVSLVSGDYFPTLAVPAAAGRTFGSEVESAHLAHPIAVVSDRFWRDRLNRAPNVIGRTIRLRQTTFQIVGLMPPSFTGLLVGAAPDVWVPLTMQEAVSPGRDWLTQPPGVARRTMFLHVLGRLKPGISIAQATTALDAVFKRGLQAEAEQIPDATRRFDLLNSRLVVRDARHGLSTLRGEYRQPLSVLMVLVGLLLLLTCANIANLLLARATGRRRELAVRVALGAGRARLVRQLLTESVMLAAIGALAGLAIAYWGDRLLLRLVGGSTPIPLATPLDGPVLLFAIGVTLVTGLLFGLVPALRATRVDLNVVLRGTATNIAGATRGRGRWPLGKILAGAQVAISLLLLITAGLFVRSLQRLGDVPLGYDADRLVMFRMGPAEDGYQQPAIAPLFEDLLARVRSAPGVRDVTLSLNGLFYGGDLGSPVSFPGLTFAKDLDMATRFDLVGPKYFSTIGMPIAAGRDVEMQDSTGVQGCWMNQAAARYFFKDRNPIGQRMVAHFSFGDAEFEIRGIVADARALSIRGRVASRFYLPYFGSIIKPGSAVFEVRTAGAATDVLPDLRRIVRETDSRLSPLTFRTVPELVGEVLSRDRLTAQLSTLFGVMALLLASIGLYGVLSYSVGRRVSEIGVRLALGSGRGRILGLIVREALTVTIAGAVVGIGVAVATTRWLGTMLFDLTPRDPVTFAGAAGLLVIVAAIAALAPAWRASRTDPLIAMRSE